MKKHLLMYSLFATLLVPSAASAIPRVGEPAPLFALPGINGGSFGPASFKGKPVYLNFYATWCGPCNDEARSIGKLSEKYKERGLTVLGVNELESQEKAKEFLTKYHLTYIAVIDSDGKVGKQYNALGLPVHVFIDRTGSISTYRLGQMTPEEIEAAIKGIL